MPILELIAQALGDVCDEVVFVGGCAAGLLLTEDRPETIRITEDVDIVAHALTARQDHQIEKKVRARGFANDMRPQAPICRWVYKQVTLDLMPTSTDILGFANRWYTLAVETAQPYVLPSGREIRLIEAPVFIATKLEAFKDRGTDSQGNPDFLGSHDLEDIMTVLDRRPSLMDECQKMPAELQNYLAQQLRGMLAQRDFSMTLAGHLPGDAASQSRLGKLRETLKSLANLAA